MPEDRTRHDEIEELLRTRLVTNTQSCQRAKGVFFYEGAQRFVEWTIIG